MKDAFGHTLKVGDRIVASHKGGRPLVMGTVVKLNPVKVTYCVGGYNRKFSTDYLSVAKYNLNEDN